MPAEHHRLDVVDRDVERLGEERAEPRGVEHTRHPDDSLTWESRHLLRYPAHHVERVRDHQDDGAGAMLPDLDRDLLDDVGVGTDQIVAAHARLARDTRGDDHELASRRGLVIVRPHDPGVEPFDRRGLPLIEGFALGYPLDHVDEDDAARELLLGEALSGGGAHVAGADDGDFVQHGG